MKYRKRIRFFSNIENTIYSLLVRTHWEAIFGQGFPVGTSHTLDYNTSPCKRTAIYMENCCVLVRANPNETLHCADSYVLGFMYRMYTYVSTFLTLPWRYRWFDKWMFEPSALPWRSSQTSFRLKVNFESAILLRLTRRGWRGLSALVITGLAGRIPKCIVNGWFSFFGWRGKTVTRNISRSVCLNK